MKSQWSQARKEMSLLLPLRSRRRINSQSGKEAASRYVESLLCIAPCLPWPARDMLGVHLMSTS